MALSTSANKVIHSGNGVATSFAYTFPILEASHLSVIYTDTGGNAITLASSLYSVTGIAGLNGGAVTYPLSGSPLASGETLTILRTVPLTQLTVFSNQGGYYPEIVEGRFDRVYMGLQQLSEEIGRATLDPPSVQRADVVETLAALKALTTRPAAVLVKGRLVSGDGWGGVFVWSGGSATTADDALVVQCTTGDAGRYKRIYDPGLFYAEWWGISAATAAATNLTQLQAAMATIEGLSGRELRITGECQISAAWVITASGVTVSGSNPYRDKIVLTSTTADGIVVGTDVAAPREVFIKNLGFDATVTKVAGASVRFRFCANCGLDNFVIVDAFKAVEVNAGYQINVQNGRIETVAVNGAGLYFEGNRDGHGGGVRGSDVYCSDITMSGNDAAEPRANIWAVDFSGLWFENVGGVNGGTGLLIAPNAGDIVEHIFSSECAWGDSGDGHGALLQPDGGTIRRWASNNDWFASSVGAGLTTAGTGTIDGLQLLNPRFLNNGTHGADFTKGSLTALSNIYLLNPVATGNSQVSPGVSSGLKFVGVDKFSVIGGRCGTTSGFGDTQKYNIEIGAGNTNYLLDGVNVVGGATAPILVADAPSATKVIWNCIGYSGAFGPYAPIDSPTFTGIVTAPVLNLSKDRADGGPLQFIDTGAGGKTYQVGQGAGNMASAWNIFNATDSIYMMQLTNAGAVTFASTVSGGAGTFNGTLSGVGLYLAGVAFADNSGNNRVLYDSDVNIVAYLGNAASPSNYFDNTTNYFRNRGGSVVFAAINATAAAFQVPVTGPSAAFSGAVTGVSFNGNTISGGTGTLTLGAGKTFTASNTLTLTGTDGSTLAIGAGGTLGSNAYTSTAYAPLASPTFTGTVAAGAVNLSGTLTLTGVEGSQLHFTLGGQSWQWRAAPGGNFYVFDATNSKYPLAIVPNSTASLTIGGASSAFVGDVNVNGQVVTTSNIVAPDAGYVYTPFNGGTNTGTVRAGIQFDGASQGVNFYTAGTYRGSFNSAGTLSLVNGVSATTGTFSGSIVSSQSGSPLFYNTSTAGTFRYFRFQSGSAARWDFGVNTDAEGGANSGSNYYISRADDAGTGFTNVLTITRSSGAAAWASTLSAVGLTSTAGLTLSRDPTAGVAIAGAGSQISVASGANVSLAVFSGIAIVSNPDNGDTAVYLCGANTAILVSSTVGSWVTPTTTPAASKTSIQYDAGAYKLYSNYGSTQVYRVVIISSRGAV